MPEIITEEELKSVEERKREIEERIRRAIERLEKELGPVQARYIKRYVEGLAEFLAVSPEEKPEERELEKLVVEAELLEKMPKLREMAKRWLERLREFVLGERL